METAGCLLYLHSQGGNRLEGKYLVEHCSAQQVCLCLFDFVGCGKSTGEYVSLGLFERLQVERVLHHLKDKYNTGSVAIWGRSMGAVTAILYAEMRPFDVCAMVGADHQVLDSPFGSMKKTVQDIAYEHYNLPNFLVSIGLAVINSSIKERIHADIFEELSPFNSSMSCSAPVIFIVAKEDGLVLPKRVRQMHEKYGSKVDRKISKHLIECEGTHTDTRDESVVNQSFSFLMKEFGKYSGARGSADFHCSDMSRYRRIKGFVDPEKAFFMSKLKVSFGAANHRHVGYPRPLGSYARGLNVNKHSTTKPRFREENLSSNYSMQNIFETPGQQRQKRTNMLRSTMTKENIINKENVHSSTSFVPNEPEAQKPILHSKLLHQHRLLAQIVENNRSPPLTQQQKPKPPSQFNATISGHVAAGNIKLNGNLLSKGLRQFDSQQRAPTKNVESPYHSFASYNPTSRLNSIDISSNIRPRMMPERDSYSSLHSRHMPQTSSMKTFDEKSSHRGSQYKPLVRPIPDHFFTESLNGSISEAFGNRPANHISYRTNQSTNCFESLRYDRDDDTPDTSSYLRLTLGGGKHY